MAFPTYVGAGAGNHDVGAIALALPASLAADDVLLLWLETANEAITIPTPNGGTWTEVTNSPQGTGTAGATTATRLTVFWSRYNGTQGNPTTSDSGDHQVGQITAYRGVKTTGDPWNITSGNTNTSSTTVSITGATTSVADCLIVLGLALADDGTDLNGSWTNADLANITTRTNMLTATGNDGRVISATAEKATAGAYGATTNTINLAVVKGCMTIALEPAAAAATADPYPYVGGGYYPTQG